MDHVQQRRVSSIPEKVLIVVSAGRHATLATPPPGGAAEGARASSPTRRLRVPLDSRQPEYDSSLKPRRGAESYLLLAQPEATPE